MAGSKDWLSAMNVNGHRVNKGRLEKVLFSLWYLNFIRVIRVNLRQKILWQI